QWLADELKRIENVLIIACVAVGIGYVLYIFFVKESFVALIAACLPPGSSSGGSTTSAGSARRSGKSPTRTSPPTSVASQTARSLSRRGWWSSSPGPPPGAATGRGAHGDPPYRTRRADRLLLLHLRAALPAGHRQDRRL